MQITTTSITLGTGIGTDVETTAGVRMCIVGRVDSDSVGPGPEPIAVDMPGGDYIVNPSGEDLGRITNIMSDVQRSRIVYTVTSMNGFLSIDDRLFTVLWSTMSLDTDRKYFVLDANKDYLGVAPGFDKDSWPTIVDPIWAQSVYEYYGLRPYWEEY